MENRICKKCQLEKPLASFPKRSGRSAHLREHTCGVCKTKRHRAIDPERCRQQRQSERIRRSARDKGVTIEEYIAMLPTRPPKSPRLRIDGLVVRKNQRRHCPVLLPIIKAERSRDYYKRNIQKCRSKVRRWKRQNPAKRSAQHFRERIRRKEIAVMANLTEMQWQAIKETYGNRCAYCGMRRRLTQDHVIPVSKGGEHTAANIVPACRRCNSSKGARLPRVVYQPHLIDSRYFAAL